MADVTVYQNLIAEMSAEYSYVRDMIYDIWELRPLDDRIFFFYFRDNTFVLLHHFLKKTK